MIGWLAMWLALPATAQNANLVVFSAEGEKFTVSLNGEPQHLVPTNYLRITGLKAPYYRVKISFEKSEIAPIEQSIDCKSGRETVFRLKAKKNRERFTLRWQSDIPINQAPPAALHQKVVRFKAPPAAPADPPASANTTTPKSDSAASAKDTVPTFADHYKLPGYDGPMGCPWPLEKADFRKLQESVAGKKFEDSKLRVANQALKSKCLLTEQVKTIMQLFEFEDSKLEFAKAAYARTFDQGNYQQVHEALEFKNSVDELQKSIGQ
ncbi:MAG: DUF4476 domain-containing protein [Bacteroidota bacterium]